MFIGRCKPKFLRRPIPMRFPAAVHFARSFRHLALAALASFLVPTYGLTAGRDEGQLEQRESVAALHSIRHIVVIYQENWSLDSLYGLFPGANGLANASPASLNQTDRFDLAFGGQFGQPFSLVAGSLALVTPPQPINNRGHLDTRFTAGLLTLVPYYTLPNSTPQPTADHRDPVTHFQHNPPQLDHAPINQ